MKVHIDLDAITANAAHVRVLTGQHGLSLQAVIKRAFLHKQIIRACQAGGVTDFGLSTPSAAGSAAVKDIAPARLHLISIAAPAANASVSCLFGSSVHSSPLQLIKASKALSSHKFFLALRTSDDREGLNNNDPASLEAFFGSFDQYRIQVAGVLANFGCRLERVPTADELLAVQTMAEAIGERYRTPPVISLGGSVLLPIIDQLPSQAILRVGEAIVSGSIPGKTQCPELSAPISLEAMVLETRPSSPLGNMQRVLVDSGSTVFEPGDIHLADHEGLLVHASGECASFDIANGKLKVGDMIRIRLGYKSAVRALSNSDIEISWK